MFSVFFPKKYLGLDIGNSAVKIAEVAVFRNRITVTRLIKAQLPPQDPEQPRDMAPVALALQPMVQKHKLRDKRIYSNLSGAYVVSRLFTMPAMTHDELLAYIRSHASEYFPASVNISEVEFDFHLLKEEFKEGQESVQLMLAAGRKKAVRSQLEMIEQAGLLPVSLDASSLSLFNSFVAHPAMFTGKPLVIIDIGHTLAKVMVVKDQLVNFVTEIAVGGDAVTRAIAQKYSLEYRQAEDVKLELSRLAKFEEDDNAIEIGQQSLIAAEVYQAALPVMKQLTGELQKIRRFLPADKAWQFMLLTGGASRTYGLKEALEAELQCPAELQDSISGIEMAPQFDREAPEFSLAIGLALKAVRPYVNSISLIPAAEKLRLEDKWISTATRSFAKAAALAMAVISAVLLLVWLGSGQVCRKTDLKFRAISTEWQKAKQLRDVNAELLRGREILKGIPAQRAGLAPALADLSRSAPQNLWLTALDIKGRMQPGQEGEGMTSALQCRLAGYSLAQEQVLSLVKSLEKSKVFEKPELKYLEKIGEKATGSLPGTAGNFRFEINVNLK